MNQDIRRELIGRNLGIKPINHGQVHTFQIALPEAKQHPIPLERRNALERSLSTYQSNLTSLIIRRTNTYADEEIEYELVYGADWLQLAQELQIEKVWAWVFDMTDEQAIATAAEMELLTPFQSDTGSPNHGQPPSLQENASPDISTVLDQKLQLAADSIKHSLTAALTGFRDELDEKLKVLTYRLDGLHPAPEGVSHLDAILEKLNTLQHQLTSTKKTVDMPFSGEPVNLLTASDQEIREALNQVKTQDKYIQSALDAIHYCKQSEQGLTWGNLRNAANKKSKQKISGFAEGTYERLRVVAEIPEAL